MKRLGFCVVLAVTLAAVLPAQAPMHPRAAASGAEPVPPPSFGKYCFECHGSKNPKAGLSIQGLVDHPSIAVQYEKWEKVAEMLETGQMPPLEADDQPSDGERAETARWIRTSLDDYERRHAGEPGHVTVRRLTTAEYGYAIRDLTGIDIPVGIEASSDSVGGEGFANFGDVQFVQDESVERYLEAAKQVAEHAVIGAGPLDFYADTGRTGLELSALNRIDNLYAANGFRVVSGEGGRPFGLERYGKAFYVSWYYRHRAALGDPAATIRGLAAREGITGRFAEHIWSVVNRRSTAYPTRETIDAWDRLPAPTPDVEASIAQARAGCDVIQQRLTTWPSWFFARGDLAAGGAGDESPLAFTDETLKAESTHPFSYALALPGGRGRGPSAPGRHRVYVLFTDVAPGASTRPVIVFRNPTLVTRGVVPAGGRGAPAGGRRGPGPVLSTRTLRAALAPEAATVLHFGTSPDASILGPDDFAATGPVSFVIDVPEADAILEFHADAELGADRDAVVRVMLSDKAEGSARDAAQRVVFGDPGSTGYRAFRANIAQYVALLPPNSHGEANPADKDPVPAPFDNTYNSPEHDAFVLKVKYQRSDAFFTENMVDGADRVRLDQAWTDLFGSWPYHDAYLGMLIDHYGLTLPSRRVADLDGATIAAQPADVRPYLTALRARYDTVIRTMIAAQPGHVSDALTFASRAWRRPLTTAEDAGLRAFYQKARTVNGLDHDGALRALIARILVSPAFLYRVETAAQDTEQPLDGWEMASRLSFFLWSSVPDDELRRAAAAGDLAKPALLDRQVRRMVASPKARRLATEFFGQWLGFYHFDQFRGVDTSRFPEFTDAVRTSMYDEAISTFEYIVRQNRPVRDILHADYTFLNKPLAAFYGIDTAGARDDAMVKVDGANAFNRGGALRLGAVLTVTSAPLRTSPVKRGNWVLRNVVGTPTPPPPPDAGTIPADPKSFNGLTLRQRLAQHKRNDTCAACHLRIDPLGFPLEGYDAVGRPRRAYDDGTAVDVTGEFADKSTIVGVGGLLEYLDGKDRQVMITLSKKMLGYALGRTVLASDRPLMAEMTAAGGSATFADLAVTIVTSRQFRNHAGDEPGADTSVTPAVPSGAGQPQRTGGR